MLLPCGAGEDSWESLELQGDPTSPSSRKSSLNIHWKDWCWSWSSNSLATWYEEPTYWKNPDAGKEWRQEEKGKTEDEMVGWHHWLMGHEFEQTPGGGDREAWLAAIHGVTKSQTWLNNWTVTEQQQRLKGFTGSSEDKESTYNAGRPGFNPWIRKIPWKREWQPTPVFLPWEFHGQRSLVDPSPCGHRESDMTEWLINLWRLKTAKFIIL